MSTQPTSPAESELHERLPITPIVVKVDPDANSISVDEIENSTLPHETNRADDGIVPKQETEVAEMDECVVETFPAEAILEGMKTDYPDGSFEPIWIRWWSSLLAGLGLGPMWSHADILPTGSRSSVRLASNTPVGIISLDSTGRQQHHCPYFPCTQAYGSVAELKKHMNEHRGGQRYKCPWPNCGKTLSRDDDRTVSWHIRRHIRGSSVPLFRSELVDEMAGPSTASSSSRLEVPVASASGEGSSWKHQPTVRSPRISMKRRRSNCAGRQFFRCTWEDCSKAFTTKGSLKVHARKHTGPQTFYKCSWKDCSKAFPHKGTLKVHFRTHTAGSETPYKCSWEECDKAFRYKNSLHVHVRTHTGEKPFSCSSKGCNESFTGSRDLIKHLRAMHEDSYRFSCTWPDCNKRFFYSCELRVHTRSHTKTRPFKCSWEGCGKAFLARGSLTRHSRIHSGERPFKCTEDCGKTFADQTALKKHVVTHTHDHHAGQQPFQCTRDGCAMAFIPPDALSKHDLAHCAERPYKCEWEGCGRAFMDQPDLKKHIRRIHSGEKKFKCLVEGCDKSYVIQSDLIRHSKRHTPDRPCKCDWEGCTKDFATAIQLRVHKSTAHTPSELRFKCTWEGCTKAYFHRSKLARHIQSSHKGDLPVKCTQEGCVKAFRFPSELTRHMKTHLKSTSSSSGPAWESGETAQDSPMPDDYFSSQIYDNFFA